MADNQTLLMYLQNKAVHIRIDSIRSTTAAKSGHPTSCLSSADIVAVLFFHVMKCDLDNPKACNNDRFILSKGHAVPVIYAAYKNLGVIDDEELLSLRKFDSNLEGHPTPRFIYNEAATGSLGQGLSIGLGMALNAVHDKLDYKTYVLMGDGESAEGSIWEAVELAAHYKLNNLVGILDVNRLGQSDQALHDRHAERYAQQFEAFGWHTIIVDGHNMASLLAAFDEIQNIHDRPTIIIARTIKGYGIDHVHDKLGFHGRPFTHQESLLAIQELETRFKDAYEHAGPLKHVSQIPEHNKNVERFQSISLDLSRDFQSSLFARGEKLATRKAFGYALAALGRKNNMIVALDADVKNSTYTEIFEKEFPDRFIQCYIAEQNMISIATGLQSRGKIPFAATFAAFFTRAHDQIRMASIGRNALRLCGSHAGVSIGEDGPSQMGLEDIALFRAIPNSIVLYPSDGVSTYKLTELMANYHDGISYLRTTRAVTPNLYDFKEEFKIGGCKVLKQSSHDMACLIGAGITLHEALKAHKMLEVQGVNVSVVDLYSIKPMDIATIKDVARKSRNKIVVVEDHYAEGGMSEALMHHLFHENIQVKVLAVEQISRSGTPDELMASTGIDAQNIVGAVLSLL